MNARLIETYDDEQLISEKSNPQLLRFSPRGRIPPVVTRQIGGHRN